MKIRINKLLSDTGLGSRREVEQYITEGRVLVNGRKASLSDQVSENDLVLLDGVDLPIRDLVRDLIAEKTYAGHIEAKNKARSNRNTNPQKARAELQRENASPKSAALRKTSHNNPTNRILRDKEAKAREEEAYGEARTSQRISGGHSAKTHKKTEQNNKSK